MSAPDEAARCPRCGTPMIGGGGVALVNTGRSCVRVPLSLPLYCPDRACARRREEEEALAAAIARGVIDP